MISKHNYAPLAGADTRERIALSGNTSHTNAFKKAASGQVVGEMLHFLGLVSLGVSFMFLLVVDVIAPSQPIVDAYAFIPRLIRGILQKRR